uniref:Uncharacterized protein n=1 Tax=Rhizophora mucronata TaxID=61149 RepID=A0A2P2NAI4_RHIMU
MSSSLLCSLSNGLF